MSTFLLTAGQVRTLHAYTERDDLTTFQISMAEPYGEMTLRRFGPTVYDEVVFGSRGEYIRTLAPTCDRD